MALIRDNNSFGTDIIYGEMRPSEFVNVSDVSTTGEANKIVKLGASKTLICDNIEVKALSSSAIPQDGKVLWKGSSGSVKGASVSELRNGMNINSKSEVTDLLNKNKQDSDKYTDNAIRNLKNEIQNNQGSGSPTPSGGQFSVQDCVLLTLLLS